MDHRRMWIRHWRDATCIFWIRCSYTYIQILWFCINVYQHRRLRQSHSKFPGKKKKKKSYQVFFSFTSPLQRGLDAFPPSASSSRRIVLNIRSSEKVLTNLIYFLKNILVRLTHWNRHFSFVSPSVFSRSLLFSLP